MISKETAPRRPERVKVLCISEELGGRVLLTQLEQRGFDAAYVTSERELWAFLQCSAQPHAIVLDCVSFLETRACDCLCAVLQEEHDLPVLVLRGPEYSQDPEKCLQGSAQAGAVEFMKAPHCADALAVSLSALAKTKLG